MNESIRSESGFDDDVSRSRATDETLVEPTWAQPATQGTAPGSPAPGGSALSSAAPAASTQDSTPLRESTLDGPAPGNPAAGHAVPGSVAWHDASADPAPAAVADPAPPEPMWLRGPAPTPIIIGVLGLLAAVMCGLAVGTTLTINWVVAAPALIIGFGVLIVALGLLNARRSRPE